MRLRVACRALHCHVSLRFACALVQSLPSLLPSTTSPLLHTICGSRSLCKVGQVLHVHLKTPGEARVFVGTKTPRRAVASLPPLMRATLPSARASIEGCAATDATTMVDARRTRRSPVRVSWSGRIEIQPTILVTTDKAFASLQCDFPSASLSPKETRETRRRRSGRRRERSPPNRDAHSTNSPSWGRHEARFLSGARLRSCSARETYALSTYGARYRSVI